MRIDSYLSIVYAYWKLLAYCVRLLKVTRVLCTPFESYSSIVLLEYWVTLVLCTPIESYSTSVYAPIESCSRIVYAY